MIGKLTGKIDSIADGSCLIDVGGVGYVVQASSRTLSGLPPGPGPAVLLIETHVREDAILLYGFADPAERDWFRLLTTVQGVGAKLAIRILSELRDKAGVMPVGQGFALPPPLPQGVAEDVLSALVHLGYRRAEAQPAVARVIERLGDKAELDAVVRDALKELGR